MKMERRAWATETVAQQAGQGKGGGEPEEEAAHVKKPAEKSCQSDDEWKRLTLLLH